MLDQDVSLVAVGDVFIGTIQNPFAETASILKAADIAFCNLEGPTSHKGEPKRKRVTLRSDPKAVFDLANAGFNVVSFANNHCLDYGLAAYLETISRLKENKIKYAGAGRNISEARKPAILERKGIRVGFLAYASVFDMGDYARIDKPGLAPVRVNPLFEPPYVNQEDLEAMVGDIKKLKSMVDVLVVSHHWGISQSRTLSPSQRAIGQACIDAGVDLVLGYHPHILQGIEVYKGKIICYSLGNFVFDLHPDFFITETGETILFGCTLSKGHVGSAYFRPLASDEKWRPCILPSESERFKAIFDRMDRLSKELGTTLTLEEEKVWILK